MNKPRLLHVSESTGWSGGAAQALFLALELAARGYENHFACPEDGVLARKALLGGFDILNFRPKRNPDLKTAFALARTYETLKPDVVHAHHPKAHNMCLMAKFFSSHKPLLIVSRRVSHPLPGNIFARLKYKSKLVNGYIAVCEHVRGILLAYGIDPEKVDVVYSGVDPEKYRRKDKDQEFKKSLGLSSSDFLISLVGNYSRDKGQHVFIKALKTLKNKGFAFKCLFAGKNTDGAELKNIFAENGFPPVEGLFLGMRDDVDKLLSVTDVSVNAAVKGEALSGSVRESLAMGIPVVASDIAGNGEIVKNGVNGLLFKKGDPDELARKIEFLMKEKELREKLSANAVASIEEKFTVKKMAENTLNIYLSRLAGQG